MKKICILGKNGMLGHLLYTYLKEKNIYEIIGLDRNDFDLRTELDVYDLASFLEYKFDYIINCIGLLVKPSEDNPDLAHVINTYLPKLLEKHFKNTNTKIIHISTDCVFDGSKIYPDSYNELDIPNEINNYGKSKANGEIRNDKDLTIRTSIIGPEIKNGTGLLHWFLDQKDRACGYINHYWNGVTTLELCKIVELSFYDNIIGLKHIYNKESVSKYELLEKIKESFKLDIELIASNHSKNINKTLTSIKRVDLLYIISSYDIQLKELKSWIESHKELYKNIYPT